MNKYPPTLILTLLFFSIVSCGESTTKSNAQLLESGIAKSAPVMSQSDTITRIEVDYYPINRNLLKADKLKRGKTISFDKVWLKNDFLNQALVIELATDGHRLYQYHFSIKDIPDDFISYIELNDEFGQLATQKQKELDIKSFINQSVEISSEHFTSAKGISLGSEKSKVLDIYGKPHILSKISNIDKLEWDFVGEITFDGTADLHGTPLAKDSFGYHVIMYFQKERLIGMILFNDVP